MPTDQRWQINLHILGLRLDFPWRPRKLLTS